MKTIYGIKQKYNLKDFVKYYQSKNNKGEPCNVQYGYIVSIYYELNVQGEPRLNYVVCESPFYGGGYIISPNNIIRKATPKDRLTIVNAIDKVIKRYNDQKDKIDEQIAVLCKKKEEIKNETPDFRRW